VAVSGEPLADQRCLVGAVVVQHQMDIELEGNGGVDFLQEIQELHRAMPAVAFVEDVAGGDTESGKQAGDAVSLVVMCASFPLSSPHGQHGCVR
jgi:hypothetical protein